MITISLCMIVRNEEKTLPICLDSIKELVDEIVIVDTGSTDRTKEVAAGYGARIYDFKWDGNFSNARNFAFDKAACDYIYSADADEEISISDQRKFLLLKKCIDPEIDIVQMIYTNQLAAKTVYNFDKELRPKLFKRLRKFVWEDPIHEQVRLTPVVYDSDIEIIHRPLGDHAQRDLAAFRNAVSELSNEGTSTDVTGNSTDTACNSTDTACNSTDTDSNSTDTACNSIDTAGTGATSCCGKPLSSRLFQMYAREMMMAGTDEDFRLGGDYFAQEACNDDRSVDEIRQASCVAARAARIEGNLPLFMKFALKELSVDASSEMCCELGEYYFALGDIEEAILWFYNAAYETESIMDIRRGKTIPLTRLADCYHELGDTEHENAYRTAAEQ